MFNAELKFFNVGCSFNSVVALTAGSVRQWTRNGDIDKLEQLVFDGQGHRLEGEQSQDTRIKVFLKSVPRIMEKCTALHEAVLNGSLGELQDLLKNDPMRRKYALCKDAAGVGLLHKAVYYDFMDIVGWLASSYPQTVHQKDSEGRTPLHYACMCRDPSLASGLLVRAGADRGARDASRRLPSQYAPGGLTLPSATASTTASTGGATNMPAAGTLDGLLIKPANIRIWCHDQNLGRLQRVVWEGQGARLRTEVSSQPTVKKFLETVPYIMNTIKDIHTAVMNNDIDAVKSLTADPVPSVIFTSKDANGLNVLHKAAGLGYLDILELVARACPAAISASDSFGRTPLHYAASLKGDRSAYDALLQHGVEEGKLDIKMKTAGYYLNRPNELDRTYLMVTPEAPRVPTSSYPHSWDWSLLEANYNADNHKSRLRRKAGSTENILSNNHTSDSMLDLSAAGAGGKMIKSITIGSMNGSKEIEDTPEENADENAAKEESAGTDRKKEGKEDNENEENKFIPITELNGNLHEEEEKPEETEQNDQKEEAEEKTYEDDFEEPTLDEDNEGKVDQVQEVQENDAVDKIEEPKNGSNGSLEVNADDSAADNEVNINDSNENETENELKVEEKMIESKKEEVEEGGGAVVVDKQEDNDVNKDTKDENGDDNKNENIDENKDDNVDDNDSKDKDDKVASNDEEPGDDNDDVVSKDNDSQDGDISHQSTAEAKDIEKPEGGETKEGNDLNETIEPDEDMDESHLNEVQQGNFEIDEIEDVDQLINSGNMEQLAALVLNGEGHKLQGKTSENAELQAFLDNVPNYMNKIQRVHIAAREGKLRDLQAALDRRKFAIARDSISPNGATPLHVATVFGHTNIMQYLGGRFPETLSAVDFEGRTALHYAATIPDNGHYYNLLQHLGANARDLDDEGRSAELYLNNDHYLTYQQLIDDFGIDPQIAAEMLQDKVPEDKVSSRRELRDTELLVTLERCFKLLQDSRQSSSSGVPPSASSNQGSPTTFLGRFLTRPTFEKIKYRITNMNHNLFDVIWPSVKRLPENKFVILTVEEDFVGGIVAPDYNAYAVFEEFLMPLVKDLHCMKVTADIHNHPKSQFFPEADIDEDLFESNLNVDVTNKYVLSGMIECSRNLEEFELPINLRIGQLEFVERIFTSIFLSKEFADILNSESGNYYTLNEILERPSEIRAALAASSLLIPICDNSDIEDDERYYGKSWPYGRGVYVSGNYEMAAWINVQDHVRVVVSTPREVPGEIGQPYTKLARIMTLLHKKLRFKWDECLGHLSSRPLFLGNSLHFNLMLHIPNLSKEAHALRSLFTVRGLHCRETMSSDIVRVGNYQSIGVTELQTFEDFSTAIANIFYLEKDMAMQSTVHVTDMLMNIFKRKRSSLVDSS